MGGIDQLHIRSGGKYKSGVPKRQVAVIVKSLWYPGVILDVATM